jgi:predicted SAM-dependent methyltransferase
MVQAPPIDFSLPLRLHLGGQVRAPGWVLIDAQAGDHVDIQADLSEPLPVPDQCASLVYASHVIEHLSFPGGILRALREIRRVLIPGCEFCVAVPDMDALCRLFLMEDLSMDERLRVMTMMFGAQVDAYDLHKVGFNQAILQEFLVAAGFAEAARVDRFDYFDDCSVLEVRGIPISLNLIAR